VETDVIRTGRVLVRPLTSLTAGRGLVRKDIHDAYDNMFASWI
jgi:hypothetical protein